MNLICKPEWDGTLEAYTVPVSCPVCRKCRLLTDRGMCVHGGPYGGYVEVDNKSPGLLHPGLGGGGTR